MVLLFVFLNAIGYPSIFLVTSLPIKMFFSVSALMLMGAIPARPMLQEAI